MAKYINLLKNMETLNRLPWAAQSAVFKKLESIADVSAMTRPTFWVHFSTLVHSFGLVNLSI